MPGRGAPTWTSSRLTPSALAPVLVLAQRAIGAALIDNVNASIHLRSLLTDMFLIDSAFDAATTRSPGPAMAGGEFEVVTGGF